MDHDHLAVDDSLSGNIYGAGYGGESLGPVEAIAGECALSSVAGVKLHAVTVVFDFVYPAPPLGALVFRVASCGLMNPGIEIRIVNDSTDKRSLK